MTSSTAQGALVHGLAWEHPIGDGLKANQKTVNDFNALFAGQAAFAILEHEQMHQETLLYMFHEMPYELKSPRRPLRTNGYVNRQPDTKNRSIRVLAGEVTIGARDGDFAWDNELPAHCVDVGEFRVDRHNVTNRDYLDYMRATRADPPHFWARREGEWFWRGMFEMADLPLDAAVYATQEEAVAAKPTADFDAKVTGATAMTADRFVGQLYQELKKQAPGFLGIEKVKWNFTKFLINGDRQVVKRFAPTTKPEDLAGKIESLLQA